MDDKKALANMNLLTFSRFVGREELAKFCIYYEIMKEVVGVTGFIADCGVRHGFSLFSFANLSEILEPYNFNRKIYGFDTFSGFPSVHANDGEFEKMEIGYLGLAENGDSFE